METPTLKPLSDAELADLIDRETAAVRDDLARAGLL